MNQFISLINRVAADVNEPDLFERIKDACRKKQAFCFGDENTLAVLRLMDLDGEKYMLVWLGISSGTGALAKFNPIVTELTRAAGAGWFEFCTTRRGFVRVAGKLGFIRLPDDEQGRMRFRKNVR
ncbi:hypothetical protein OGW06_06180 [Citrobacter sp. Cf128]|uniref:hypothetical protein n=1 Tax=Citrobacter TaxID=544 RepID=UPI000AC01BFE|nr:MULTISPECIES: hypothetical protein [Citrobacter]MDM3062434.1 hypothetical protein [Citrobacter sp. Cf146]MDM3077634.1 hypothetical protein [Citrobacter sp. Cf138]MDM3099728.1 hypothetical protein [Citrobacter sp. Cf140]MDM3111820.1 hypothetical protein [Citrobacter sp. Cf128]MDM3118338.1 hypothetical protein [Citrobacter sp. Cf135]